MVKRFGLFFLVNLLIVTAVTVLLSALGLSRGAQGTEGLALMCLVWGVVGSMVSLLLSRWLAKVGMGLEPLDRQGEFGFVARRVEEYARLAKIETPEVYWYDSDELNAFATGPSRDRSLVAVSRGLLERLTQEEVEGVLGHEVAHIANGDMVTMALVQGVVNAFVMFVARVTAFAIDQVMRDEEGRGGLGLLAQSLLVMVLQAVFGLLTMPVVAWFSRQREFRADEGGARLAGRAKMIAALEALRRDFSPERLDGGSPELSAMKISGGGVMALLSTHPPLEVRVAVLRRS
ncbi:MAG: protease HtpX [Deltaproteobacteria bacterium]|nr:protease HtpX [Deltaproteobacteria bacterium]